MQLALKSQLNIFPILSPQILEKMYFCLELLFDAYILSLKKC
jgi:hypothetical protein